jgi:hypothetical protein
VDKVFDQIKGDDIFVRRPSCVEANPDIEGVSKKRLVEDSENVPGRRKRRNREDV